MSDKISKKYFLFTTTCFLLLTTIVFPQRTDIIIMNNGDHYTGEIKKLKFGIVTFKTDDAGTLSIKWDKIKHLISKNIFEVQVQDGRAYYGALDTTYSVRQMVVKSKDQTKFLFKIYIVEITPIKDTFWDILDGYVKIGFNYTKGSATGQFTLGGNTKYRTRHRNLELNLNSIISFQKQKESSRKQDLTLYYQRFLKHKWILSSSTGLEQNTELGIELRALINLGGGYTLIQSNENYLYTVMGLSLNREAYTDTTQSVTNLEGLISSQYQLFIYDHPKASLNTNMNIYPGLTDWGRIRINYDITLSWEMILDLYWDLSGYYSYDNKPTSGASSNDYGINTSFKYEF
ncbi:MAG: DUF481 domain-containing protein [Ignavibacteriaceae bacterium]